MKESAKYIVLALLPMVLGCSDETPETDIPDMAIRICAGMETRTLLYNDDINVAGTELKLYGFESNDDATSTVMDGLIATPQNSLPDWNIWKSTPGGEKVHIFWDNKSDYMFYSWLQKDRYGKSTESFFGGTFTYSDAEGEQPAKLSISGKTMPLDDSGFDFCYSEVETRSRGGSDYSSVYLKLSHLFASFSISASNRTSETIKISSITLYGLKDTKSATISFKNSGTEVIYSNATSNATAGGKKLNDSDIEIAAGKSKADITGTASDKTEHILIWPQEDSELTATGYSDSEHAPEGGTYLKIVYTTGGHEYTRYVQLPKDADGSGWPAGVRQNMELSFAEKSLSLTVVPLPWNLTSPVYDYEGAASVSGKLTLVDGFVNPESTKDVYFKSSSPILLEFKIDSPLNASWMIEKIGDFDAFEIDNVTPGTGNGIAGDGIDTKEGMVDGEIARIAISPKISAPQKDYRIQLSFTIRGSNGTVTEINSGDEGIQGGTGRSDWYSFYILK